MVTPATCDSWASDLQLIRRRNWTFNFCWVNIHLNKYMWPVAPRWPVQRGGNIIAFVIVCLTQLPLIFETATPFTWIYFISFLNATFGPVSNEQLWKSLSLCNPLISVDSICFFRLLTDPLPYLCVKILQDPGHTNPHVLLTFFQFCLAVGWSLSSHRTVAQ